MKRLLDEQHRCNATQLCYSSGSSGKRCRGSPSAEHRSIGNGSVEPGSQSAGEEATASHGRGKPTIGEPRHSQTRWHQTRCPRARRRQNLGGARAQAQPCPSRRANLKFIEQGLCPELHETSLVPQPHVVLPIACAECWYVWYEPFNCYVPCEYIEVAYPSDGAV